MTDWPAYLAWYHAHRPGITEDLLEAARHPVHGSPYDWLAAPLPSTGPVLDLACGSAPVAARVSPGRYLGVDRSAAELREARRRGRSRLVLGEAGAPPVCPPVAAVTVAMALMLLDLDAVLDAVRPLLEPEGVLAAIVPTRAPGAAVPTYARLLADLGQAGVSYPEPLGPGLQERVGGHGFTVRADDTAVFDRPVQGAADVSLVVDSFYTPHASGDLAVGRDRARDRLAREVPVALGYPIRRLLLSPVSGSW